MVKIRDGQVANRPIYAAIGVTLAGEKDVLGLWAGTGGEGAKFWVSVLTDMKNRGITDTFFLVCDGLKGLPAATRLLRGPTVQVGVEEGLGRPQTGRETDLSPKDLRPGRDPLGRERRRGQGCVG